MASQTTGIQQLLAAEKRAADKVSEARKRKGRRLKQAKEEAQAEIEAYRNKRENDYKRYEQSVLGSRGDREKQIDKDTQDKIRTIEQNVQKHKQQALKSLLDMVYDIKPELHTNLRL
ncbi:probable V-type proton ATPase subunit G [Mercenaria mercenaria]|uniref:probable V-type proton ATPase subunit G n=1 Tax=Mercenaria mercenaria TaxID=6596 RepID=UPI001E1D4EB7|nr:probable V-type proton ATPase subunit G [Mercenaria mercenaria]